MKLIADISVIPLGVGLSLSAYVAACEKVLAEAGLKPRLHANGTNVEGDWDAVMAALRRCHEVLHAMGVPRIATNVRLGTRVDREASMDAKLASVEEKLGG
ncbi:MAG: MTH1187 family thiamine-binding protein [Thermoanaerobaculales bacterium]|jgi:uncharacterized protein (TIGR00106 family)|nr:MTH1187 family thiamine-binding protein [Thermoanaerobaculales bacterium]